jgi:hypothetical protein
MGARRRVSRRALMLWRCRAGVRGVLAAASDIHDPASKPSALNFSTITSRSPTAQNATPTPNMMALEINACYALPANHTGIFRREPCHHTGRRSNHA